jgi:hypothetical protein
METKSELIAQTDAAPDPKAETRMETSGRDVLPFVHPRCKVCSSPNRNEIEIQILLGASAPKIAKAFPEDSLNRQNIFAHKHGHMDVLDVQVEDAVRAHKARTRQEAQAAGNAVVNRLQLVEDLLLAGVVSAQAGAVRFTPRDLLALLDERDRLAGDEEAYEELKVDVKEFSDAVKEVVPRSMWADVVSCFDEKVAAREDGQ